MLTVVCAEHRIVIVILIVIMLSVVLFSIVMLYGDMVFVIVLCVILTERSLC